VYADAVRADEADALKRGLTGVPLFLVDNRFAIPGAQPTSVILRTLRRAWDETHTLVTVTEQGDGCGPDGCTV
jgi:predicted DsbA family dithiol-disulfide isomerase